MSFEVREGDCVELMAAMPACSVDAICTDPPYGLEFMGKEWDRFAPQGTTARVQRSTGGSLEREPTTPHGRTSVSPTRSNRIFKCRTCGGWSGSFSESRRARQRPCECERPDFEYRGAPSSSLAFQTWSETWATEALRVLKPGGHLLAFGGTRTYHRLVCAVEDAGFEIRDTICWLYGSGFPKSLDVGKAIDKRPGVASHREFVAHLVEKREAAGLSRADVSEKVVGTRSGACWNWEHHQFPEAKWWPALRDLLGLDDERWGPVIDEAEREVIGQRERLGAPPQPMWGDDDGQAWNETTPATPEAERWEGWGTALKPAHEPVVVARKPLSGTVAATVLEHGTGALNISGCRIEGDVPTTVQGGQRSSGGLMNATGGDRGTEFTPNGAGRWPANVVLDEQAAGLLDEQTGELKADWARPTSPGLTGEVYGKGDGKGYPGGYVGEQPSGASRFFYCAKSSRGERNAGLEGFEEAWSPTMGNGIGGKPHDEDIAEPKRNTHPTIKPISLMRWLVRLVTPPGGTVLDPFTGSGSTGCAAVLEGFDFVGLEREEEYVEIAKARIAWWHKHRGDGQAAEILAAGEVRDAVEATGQLGMFDVDVPERDRAGREGEASAERTYTDRGGSNFAMKPGRRR